MEQENITVSVITLCYNHADYIRDCLDGILSQKCDFRFELLIHDDASTDSSAAVIREYEALHPDILRPVYQTENQYSKGVSIGAEYLYPRARGKYIAYCEGDDYWTDPLKLQKQVDWMEAHPECGLVYTNVDFLYQSSGKIEKSAITSGKLKRSRSFVEHLRNAGYIAPLTWLYRREFMPLHGPRYVDGTFPLALDIWARSEVHFLDEPTAVYRILDESASHSFSLEKRYRFRTGILRIQKDYMEKYPDLVDAELRKTLLKRTYGSILRLAVVLEKEDMIGEIMRFYRRNEPLLYLFLLLFRGPFKAIQQRIYRHRGFRR